MIPDYQFFSFPGSGFPKSRKSLRSKTLLPVGGHASRLQAHGAYDRPFSDPAPPAFDSMRPSRSTPPSMADFLNDVKVTTRALLVGVQTPDMQAGEGTELLGELQELVENL